MLRSIHHCGELPECCTTPTVEIADKAESCAGLRGGTHASLIACQYFVSDMSCSTPNRTHAWRCVLGYLLVTMGDVECHGFNVWIHGRSYIGTIAQYGQFWVRFAR
jgi:hypothetical protein